MLRRVTFRKILVTLMMEALRSSETSVITRATRRNIPEDDILHSHCRENLKSYWQRLIYWDIYSRCEDNIENNESHLLGLTYFTP
jgi:hypothetical protein